MLNNKIVLIAVGFVLGVVLAAPARSLVGK